MAGLLHSQIKNDNNVIRESLDEDISEVAQSERFASVSVDSPGLSVACPYEGAKSCCAWKDSIRCTPIYVAFFAVVGCLLRISLDHALGSELANIENSGTVVIQSFFSNMLGCFLLGCLNSSSVKKQSDLYIGLTTGACGCITTFSKWNQQVTTLLVGAADGKGQPHVVALSAVVVGLLSFVSSYQIGRDVFNSPARNQTSILPVQKEFKNGFCCCRCFPCAAMCFLLTLVGISLISMAIVLGTQYSFLLAVCASGLFAPIGANLRYFLSKNVPRFSSERFILFNEVPTGTLMANIIGSTVIALTEFIETYVIMDCTSQAIFMGFRSGFVASLTTVSTFIGEVAALRKSKKPQGNRSSYLYVTLTFALCILIGCIINSVHYKLLLENYNQDQNKQNNSFVEWRHTLQPSCGL